MPLTGTSRHNLYQACEVGNVADIQAILLSYEDPDLNLSKNFTTGFLASNLANGRPNGYPWRSPY